MVEITKSNEVEQYYRSEALSQSVLKKMYGTISDIEKQIDVTKSYIKIGSAVDCILTSEKGEFEKRFYTMDSDSQNISDTIKSIVELVYEEQLKDYQNYLEEVDSRDQLFPENEITPFNLFIGDRTLKDFEPYILSACEEVNYGKTYKDDTKIKKALEGSEYFTALVESKDKVILTNEEYKIIKTVVFNLKNNHRTSRYFNVEALSQTNLVKVHYQYPIYFEYEDLECKGLLDIVIFQYDKEGNLESITPIDLKTMYGDTYEFSKSVKARRYDIQALWYTIGLTCLFPEVKIHNFQFVVESTSTPGKPLVFEVDDTLLDFATFGDKWNPGIGKLIERYKFYKKHGFTLEKEIVEAGNKPLKLGIDGIIETEDSDWGNS